MESMKNKSETVKKIIYFTCSKCGCFFPADKNECNRSIMLYGVFTRCPTCNNVCVRSDL